ncbi:9402_t:CDS:1, partial [Dentiscutata erythropus]
MNCDEAYLINIPQWGEAAEGLEFEGSSDEEYEDTGYGCYQSHLGHDHCWWNTNEDMDFYTNFSPGDWEKYQSPDSHNDWES